jgi:FtsP/CotA-like multicopper oxidase with cupredoxin domain
MPVTILERRTTMINRREFLKLGLAAGASAAVPWKLGRLGAGGSLLAPQRAFAAPLIAGLSDPAAQPKFVNLVPDALAPGFKYAPGRGRSFYTVGVAKTWQETGLVDGSGNPLSTPVWGYGGADFVSWPGRTFEVQSGREITVNWENNLYGEPHLLTSLDGRSVVDTSLHWAYSLPGYEQYSIEANGVPIVTHLHGGHSNALFDGNPEYFFSPGYGVSGPEFRGGTYVYRNDQPAGNLWYHDHALGITRLNVYAGLAGFYFVRDGFDTGKADNPLGLPAWPYEKAYAIQDRMFKANGELFYPAFPGDPAWADFITGEGLEDDDVPQPSALAEFFGDHMVVNGKIWPKEDVERRNYRLHLLNGTDSRFMAIRFRAVSMGATDLSSAGGPLPFYVIGSDQGLASFATMTDLLLSEPGSRYDIVFDFSQVEMGRRIIMENIGGDEPFGGDIPGPQVFGETNRIMAFDVVLAPDAATDAVGLPAQADGFDPAAIALYGGNTAPVDRIRKVALFEGTDEYGRLQPLLGTAEPATDFKGKPINNPDTGEPFEGAIAWHSPTTENPALNSTEIWEIYNATGDAHPVHLHLVNFQVGTGDAAMPARQEFSADVIEQPVKQHNGTYGTGFRLGNIVLGAEVPTPGGYVENSPKDMVTALPGQVTRIKATFDKPGRYVWHCHILSHEDHEMMRVLHVGGGA